MKQSQINYDQDYTNCNHCTTKIVTEQFPRTRGGGFFEDFTILLRPQQERSSTGIKNPEGSWEETENSISTTVSFPVANSFSRT